jgi:hypothetical protein
MNGHLLLDLGGPASDDTVSGRKTGFTATLPKDRSDMVTPYQATHSLRVLASLIGY